MKTETETRIVATGTSVGTEDTTEKDAGPLIRDHAHLSELVHLLHVHIVLQEGDRGSYLDIWSNSLSSVWIRTYDREAVKNTICHKIN